jgi:FtsH-binding integral membrane protein
MENVINPRAVANASAGERVAFIRRTYAHLAGAIGLFALLEMLLLNSPVAGWMLSIARTQFGWLGVLGGFIIVSWLARGFAYGVQSVGMQYLGLGLFVLAEAVIFLPLILIAVHHSSPSVLPTAGILTGCLFLGLTMVVFTTRTDFSFLGPILSIGFLVALGLIVCGAIFGFNLGTLFSGAMVLLACGAILFDTSKILHQFPPDRHVAASLELFASVALLFWYVLQILMNRD